MRWYIALAFVLVVLVGCGQQTAQPQDTTQPQTQQQTVDATVEMRNNAFVPATVTISAGDTVEWINQDGYAHTVTGFGIDEQVAAGQRVTHTFQQSGTYDYVCTIHPGMEGTVIVE